MEERVMNQETTIDLKEYWNLLKKWWWIPTALALLIGVGVAIKSYFFTEKIYMANTSLYVISKQNQESNSVAYSELQTGVMLIKDFKELVMQRAISVSVIDELKLLEVYSVEDLISNISVEAKNETRILQFSYKDPDPKMSAIIVDKIAEVFTRKVIQTMNVDNVQIIDKAEIPVYPVSPNPPRNIAVALLVGIALGFGIIVVINFMDDTIKTSEDIKKLLKLKIMVSLPLIVDDKNKVKNKNESRTISIVESKSQAAEQFRVLRTSIQFKGAEKALKRILVTSANPSEGKTWTMVNLAVVLSQTGLKVLIVDGDLRKSTVHKYFKLSYLNGLTACLPKNGDPKDYIQKTSFENIDVITSGPVPPDPSEMLGSRLMKEFLDKVSSDYDYVLVDAPPVGILTDAAVLSNFCDGVMLLVCSEQTKIDSAKNAVEELGKVNANVLGVILNKVKQTKEQYYYYYGREDVE